MLIPKIPAWLIWRLDTISGWELEAIITKFAFIERYRRLFKENPTYSERTSTIKILPAEIEGLSAEEHEQLLKRGEKATEFREDVFEVFMVFSYKNIKTPSVHYDNFDRCSEEDSKKIAECIKAREDSRKLIAITKTEKLAKKHTPEIRRAGLDIYIVPSVVNHLYGYECLKAMSTKR